MAVPNIDFDKCINCMECVNACPFGSIKEENGKLVIDASCRACGVCIKNCPVSAISFETREKADLSAWSGIMVFGEFLENKLHPVTIELLGKANELASKCQQNVYVVLAGKDCQHAADELNQYPCEKILIYNNNSFEYYRADIYTNVLEDAINYIKPAIVLVGATPVGRSLAPCAATRFRTGLTADCTVLDVDENGSLAQIRPAFGGNIMAHIVTPYTRPQFATVRYKVMQPAEKTGDSVQIEMRELSAEKLISKINAINASPKEEVLDIVDSERIVVAGKGVKTQADLEIINDFAHSIGAQVAGTRPMVEAGLIPANRQIGLSGRTVKPKLIITCGVSGAVQFVAGMKSSETIIAINTDENAPIFSIANYAIKGDLYKVIPKLKEAFAEYEGRA